VRCAFLQSESNPPPSLQALLDSEALAADREELNALYVAITRAKTRLIVSRVEPQHANSKASWWTRLTTSGAVNADAPWTLSGTCMGENADVHTQTVSLKELPALVPAPIRSTLVAEPQSLVQVLGQVVHKALEWLTPMPAHQRHAAAVHRAVKQAALQLALPAESLDAALALVQTVLSSEAAAPWLSPEGHVWAGNEVALYHEGQSLRLDRLVVRQIGDQQEWWVLDYKLNHQPQELAQYISQMQTYVRAVQAKQPAGIVKAAFITGSGQWVPLEDHLLLT
jgi:ATP-dependent helicase/nuclease subunit A